LFQGKRDIFNIPSNLMSLIQGLRPQHGFRFYWCATPAILESRAKVSVLTIGGLRININNNRIGIPRVVILELKRRIARSVRAAQTENGTGGHICRINTL
jgi:hypothetical protein